MKILFMGGVLSGTMKRASEHTQRLFVRHFEYNEAAPLGTIPAVECESEYSETGEQTPGGAHVFEFCEKRIGVEPLTDEEMECEE